MLPLPRLDSTWIWRGILPGREVEADGGDITSREDESF
ncbi:hypothetical protein KR52_06380 [Synechococcus sp. KORDI-52]|nr:hypothetical protein KR52_06380 [Synechococcus sp. KORDI-52]